MITSIDQLNLNKNYTYADYLTWQFDEMVELIKGKILRMSPAPKRWHQGVSANIHFKLQFFFNLYPCKVYAAPFDVRLISKSKKNEDITTVVQPDICVICDKEKLDERGCIGSPDLIVEILSKTSFKRDYNDKFNLYEENGVREYWIANPESKSIDVFYLHDNKYTLLGNFDEESISFKSHIFPELEINIKDIFKD